MKSSTQLKIREYNGLLRKHELLISYIDNNEIPFEDRIKHKDEHADVCGRLSALLIEILDTGYVWTDEEVVRGFNIQEHNAA
jgi:hypothetical protein